MSPWLFQVYGKNDVVVITAVRKQVSRAWIPRVAKFQTYFDVVCVQNQCGGHKLLKYSAKIWKMSIIWWNKSKYVYKTLPYVWYYPFPLWINDLVRFHLTYQEKRSVFLPKKIRLHQSYYKMLCTHFDHKTKAKLIPSYFSGTIGSNGRTTGHRFSMHFD